MPFHRFVLSRVLNVFFSRGLSLKVRDMSSGFRLMHADAVRNTPVQALDFDIVQEILVRAFAEGWKVQEVPMQYAPRAEGSSHARIIPFGMAYLRTFWSLWKLRNSILAALSSRGVSNVPFAITSQQLRGNVLLLSGTAPLQVKSLQFNGAEYPVTWPSARRHCWTGCADRAPNGWPQTRSPFSRRRTRKRAASRRSSATQALRL